MSEPYHLGVHAKLYRKTGATTYVEVGNVHDLSVTDEREEVNLDTREDGNYAATAPGKRKLGLDFKMLARKDTVDEDLDAFLDAYDAETSVELLVMNGDRTVAGHYGWLAKFVVVKAPEPQPNGDALVFEFSLRRTLGSTPARVVAPYPPA